MVSRCTRSVCRLGLRSKRTPGGQTRTPGVRPELDGPDPMAAVERLGRKTLRCALDSLVRGALAPSTTKRGNVLTNRLAMITSATALVVSLTGAGAWRRRRSTVRRSRTARSAWPSSRPRPIKQLHGAKGERGLRGFSGNDGSDGAIGSAGPAGAPGPAGGFNPAKVVYVTGPTVTMGVVSRSELHRDRDRDVPDRLQGHLGRVLRLHQRRGREREHRRRLGLGRDPRQRLVDHDDRQRLRGVRRAVGPDANAPGGLTSSSSAVRLSASQSQ